MLPVWGQCGIAFGAVGSLHAGEELGAGHLEPKQGMGWPQGSWQRCGAMPCRGALCNIMLHHSRPHNTAVHCATLCCTIMMHCATPCHTMQHHSVLCKTMVHHATQWCARLCWHHGALCSAMLHHVAPCHTAGCRIVPCHAVPYLEGAGPVLDAGARGWQRALGQCVVAGVGVVVRMVARWNIWGNRRQHGAVASPGLGPHPRHHWAHLAPRSQRCPSVLPCRPRPGAGSLSPSAGDGNRGPQLPQPPVMPPGLPG